MVGVTGQPVLRVTARKPQRYRAGFRFGPEPRVLTADDFGELDIEAAKKVVAICSDPVLTVEWPDDPEADAWVPIDDFRLSQICSIAFADDAGELVGVDFARADIAAGELLQQASKDTLGAAGASASSGADVTIPEQDGGGADNQPSTVAPPAPVAADQDVAANVPEPVAPPHDVPEPTTTQFPKATPSGRKAKAKPAKAD